MPKSSRKIVEGITLLDRLDLDPDGHLTYALNLMREGCLNNVQRRIPEDVLDAASKELMGEKQSINRGFLRISHGLSNFLMPSYESSHWDPMVFLVIDGTLRNSDASYHEPLTIVTDISHAKNLPIRNRSGLTIDDVIATNQVRNFFDNLDPRSQSALDDKDITEFEIKASRFFFVHPQELITRDFVDRERGYPHLRKLAPYLVHIPGYLGVGGKLSTSEISTLEDIHGEPLTHKMPTLEEYVARTPPNMSARLKSVWGEKTVRRSFAPAGSVRYVEDVGSNPSHPGVIGDLFWEKLLWDAHGVRYQVLSEQEATELAQNYWQAQERALRSGGVIHLESIFWEDKYRYPDDNSEFRAHVICKRVNMGRRDARDIEAQWIDAKTVYANEFDPRNNHLALERKRAQIPKAKKQVYRHMQRLFSRMEDTSHLVVPIYDQAA